MAASHRHGTSRCPSCIIMSAEPLSALTEFKSVFSTVNFALKYAFIFTYFILKSVIIYAILSADNASGGISYALS